MSGPRSAAAALVFCALSAFASADVVSQSVFPEGICVGDSAFVRVLFRSERPFLPDDFAGELELDADVRAFERVGERCAVRGVALSRAGDLNGWRAYSLVVRFVPWRAGEIDIPPFDVGALVQRTRGGEAAYPVQVVDIAPFQVGSVAEREGASSFRPPLPPLLVPGTAGILVLFGAALFAAVFALVFALSRVGALPPALRSMFARAALRRNSRAAARRLRRLARESPSLSDAEFAARIQSVVRAFLAGHVGSDFSALSSAEIFRRLGGFGEGRGDFAPALDALSRTDVVRYARSVPGSAFAEGEREAVVGSLSAFVRAAVGREALR